MNYSRIIDRAFEITWRHKVLWVFGIALALFGGMSVGGNPASGLRYRFNGADWERFPYLRNMPFNWEAFAAGLMSIIALLLILAIFWTIVGIIVRYTSIGALIGMTADIEAGETPDFRSGLQRGWRRLVQLFLIGLVISIGGFLIGLAMLLLLALIGGALAIPAIALIGSGRGGWNALGVLYTIVAGLGFIGIAILAALAVAGALSVTREYAFRASVLQGQDVFDAISTGFRLLREHLKESAWIWVLLGLIEMALSILLVPLFILIGVAVAVPIAAVATVARAMWLLLLLGIPLVGLAAVALIAIRGIYETFRSVTWTLVYQKLFPGEEKEGLATNQPMIPQEGTV